jgi:hypothetical protein
MEDGMELGKSGWLRALVEEAVSAHPSAAARQPAVPAQQDAGLSPRARARAALQRMVQQRDAERDRLIRKAAEARVHKARMGGMAEEEERHALSAATTHSLLANAWYGRA